MLRALSLAIFQTCDRLEQALFLKFHIKSRLSNFLFHLEILSLIELPFYMFLFCHILVRLSYLQSQGPLSPF